MGNGIPRKYMKKSKSTHRKLPCYKASLLDQRLRNEKTVYFPTRLLNDEVSQREYFIRICSSRLGALVCVTVVEMIFK